jgi:hypothetical protein
MQRWLGSLFFVLSGSLLACGEMPSTEEPLASTEMNTGARAGDDVDSTDPGAGAPYEGKAADVAYPAPHPSMPQIPHHGGAVLKNPVLVGVTFPGDALAERLKAFDQDVVNLRWWPAVASGYGVGSGTYGGHVYVNEAPASKLSDSDVEDWLAKKIADQTLPAPTDQTLYILYYPSSTTVTLDGAASCREFLGFHSAATVQWQGSDMKVAYAVVNRCNDLDQVTETSSHEIAEAISDPQPLDVQSLGYMLLESNAWTMLGGENADMCAGVAGVTENGWSLTRVWKNQNAALGQQPCVPEGDSDVPYFNAGIVKDTIAATAGTTVSTEVDCYSFGPLSGPIQLSVQVYGKSGLSFGFDRKTCNNGDKVTMSITVPAGARRGTDYHYNLVSRLDDRTAHLWRGMVHVR